MLKWKYKEKGSGEKEITNLQNREIELFVKSNYDYYKRKWNTPLHSPYAGWNWVAFFFALEWLIYRKMYFFAFSIILFSIVPSVISYYFNYDVPITSRMIYDVFRILIAIFGNGLYRKRLMNNLRQCDVLKNDEKEKFLRQKGGTSVISLVICLIFGLAYLLYMLA